MISPATTTTWNSTPPSPAEPCPSSRCGSTPAKMVKSPPAAANDVDDDGPNDTATAAAAADDVDDDDEVEVIHTEDAFKAASPKPAPPDGTLDRCCERAWGAHPNRPGELPLLMPAAVNRNKVLFELEGTGEAVDLEGDVGVVGRLLSESNSMQMDLKGVVYNARILPTRRPSSSSPSTRPKPRWSRWRTISCSSARIPTRTPRAWVGHWTDTSAWTATTRIITWDGSRRVARRRRRCGPWTTSRMTRRAGRGREAPGWAARRRGSSGRTGRARRGRNRARGRRRNQPRNPRSDERRRGASRARRRVNWEDFDDVRWFAAQRQKRTFV